MQAFEHFGHLTHGAALAMWISIAVAVFVAIGGGSMSAAFHAKKRQDDEESPAKKRNPFNRLS
jgi:flagellar basal body-associated protein FliL